MTRHHSAAQTYRNPVTYRTLRRAERAIWFVAFTNPRCERRAAAGVGARGITSYLPMRAAWARHAGYKTRMEHPLFPRYLFIGVPSLAQLSRLRGVDGIEGILRNGDVPMQVPVDVIAELNTAHALGKFDATRTRPDQRPLPQPGAKLNIVDGAFASFPAIVHAAGLTAGCIEVLVEIFGRRTVVKIPFAHLELA